MPSRTADIPGRSEPPPPAIDGNRPLSIESGAISEHLVDLVPHLRLQLPESCEWLGHGMLEFVAEHPVDAGSTADTWVGKMGNRKVAVKVYRCDSCSNYLVTYMVSGTYVQCVPLTGSLLAEVLQRSTGL